jgi:clan AA aspartic protease
MYTMETDDMEKTNMGTVYAEITLKNAGDVSMVKRGLIKEPEIRETTVQAVVDTGAITLIINEGVRQELGLAVEGLRKATLANDQEAVCQLTEPVAIHWKNRVTACQALVVPGNREVLLGAIPLEGMDLMVNPVGRELVGAHGDEPVYMVM